MENFFCQIYRAFDLGRATGEHDAARDQVLKTGAANFRLHQREQLVVTRLDHFGQILAAECPRWTVANAGHLDGFVGTGQLGQRAGILDLDFVGMLLGGTQGHGDIVGHLVTGNRNIGGMTNRPFGEDGNVCGATADIHNTDTQLTLIFRQHRMGTGQLLENDVVHFQIAATHTLLDVLGRINRTGNQMHLGFKTHATHANGLTDTFLIVHHIFLRQHMQGLLVGRNRYRLGGINDPVDISLGDLTITNGDNAVGVEASHMGTGNTCVDSVNVTARHQLCFFDRALNGAHRGLDIHHHAFLHAARGL